MIKIFPTGSADTPDVLTGKTFYNKVGYKTGSMINKVGSALLITPSTVDQAIPQGYYGGLVGDGKVVGDVNLVAGNIITGFSIFGVAGTAGSLVPGNTYIYYDGRPSVSNGSSSMVKLTEISINKTGSIRAFYSYINGGITTTTNYFQIYKNGVAAGTYISNTNKDTYTQTHDDIAVTAGDLIQVYAQGSTNGSAIVKNMAIGIVTPNLAYVQPNI